MSRISTLLVDDNPDFLDSARRFLELDGRLEIVGLARSGGEALEQCGHLRPELVLMDWAMPEMNGLEATRRLKQNAGAPTVVILTQHDDATYRQAAAAAGADGFIAKAEFVEQLIAAVEALLPPPQPATAGT